SLPTPTAAQATPVARRVTAAAEAAWINERRGKTVVASHHLCDPAIAHYYVEAAGALATTGCLVHADLQLAYIADIFTFPAYRGRGMATGLIRRMLAAAAPAGATQSLLLATAETRRLYAKLGYSDLLCAQVYV